MNALHISHHIYAVHCILHSHHTDYLNVACVQDPGYTKNMCVRLRKEKCDSEKQNGTTKIFQIRATALFPSDSFFPFLSLSLAAPSFLLLFIWSLLPPFYLSSYFYGRPVSLPSPNSLLLRISPLPTRPYVVDSLFVRMHLLTETIECYYKYHAAVHYRNMDTKIAPSEKHSCA